MGPVEGVSRVHSTSMYAPGSWETAFVMMFSGSLPGFTTLEQHLETPAILVLFLTAPDDIYAKRNPQSAILMLKAPKSLQSFRNQKMPLADFGSLHTYQHYSVGLPKTRVELVSSSLEEGLLKRSTTLIEAPLLA